MKRLVLLIILLLGTEKLYAQVPVFDPSNFSQNILQAIRALKSNINEAKMIANEVEMLSNDVKNLTKLPYSTVHELETQFQSLFSEMGKVHGLVDDLTNLQNEYERLYPEFSLMEDKIEGRAISQLTSQWLEESRNSMLKASLTGAKVLSDLPSAQSRVERLVTDSSNAVGILQAAQAGNEISAMVVGNLTNLNAQLATYNSAHSNYLMQINSGANISQNRMKHVLDGLKPNSGKRVPIEKY